MTKLRKSARDKDCTLRLSCCNGDPATTVLAHLPSKDKGMGMKVSDAFSCYACSSCHDAIDGRRNDVQYDGHDLLRALYETQRSMINDGLIVIK